MATCNRSSPANGQKTYIDGGQLFREADDRKERVCLGATASSFEPKTNIWRIDSEFISIFIKNMIKFLLITPSSSNSR